MSRHVWILLGCRGDHDRVWPGPLCPAPPHCRGPKRFSTRGLLPYRAERKFISGLLLRRTAGSFPHRLHKPHASLPAARGFESGPDPSRCAAAQNFFATPRGPSEGAVRRRASCEQGPFQLRARELPRALWPRRLLAALPARSCAARPPPEHRDGAAAGNRQSGSERLAALRLTPLSSASEPGERRARGHRGGPERARSPAESRRCPSRPRARPRRRLPPRADGQNADPPPRPAERTHLPTRPAGAPRHGRRPAPIRAARSGGGRHPAPPHTGRPTRPPSRTGRRPAARQEPACCLRRRPRRD